MGKGNKEKGEELSNRVGEIVVAYLDEHLDEYIARYFALHNLTSMHGNHAVAAAELSHIKGELADERQKVSGLQQKLAAVQARITDYNELGEKLKRLQQNYDIAIYERDIANGKIDALMRENEKISMALADMTKERDWIQDDFEQYKGQYAELEQAYALYQALNEQLKSDLRGIFGQGESILAFYSGAAQENHLSDFWDFIAGGLNNNRLSVEQANHLRLLFDFCLAAVNAAYPQTRYLRLNVTIGDEFDPDEMEKHFHSPQIGRVVKVYLVGIAEAYGGRIIKKNLVALG